MVDHVVLIIISRKRPLLLRRAITSAMAHAGKTKLNVLVQFDDDTATLANMPSYPWAVYTNCTPRRYYVRAANRAFKAAQNVYPDATHFALIDDDCEFVEFAWADECVKYHRKKFPDGMGILEMESYNECCHIFSTYKYFNERHDGVIYDRRYLQFYHDTALRYAVGEEFDLMSAIPSTQRKFMLHHRDLLGGAWEDLRDIYLDDRDEYFRQAKENGWSLFGNFAPKDENPWFEQTTTVKA